MRLNLVAEHFTPAFVIDVGANVGHWCRDAKAVWPSAAFYLIEGNPECEPQLRESGEAYSIALLSDVPDKKVTFYTRKGSPTCTGASIYLEDTAFYDVEHALENEYVTSTLDQVMLNRDAPPGVPLLLKIDVQGSELDVLKGAPIVLGLADAALIEVTLDGKEYNRGAPHESEVRAFMLAAGFTKGIPVAEIVHPITREQIQADILFLR